MHLLEDSPPTLRTTVRFPPLEPFPKGILADPKVVHSEEHRITLSESRVNNPSIHDPKHCLRGRWPPLDLRIDSKRDRVVEVWRRRGGREFKGSDPETFGQPSPGHLRASRRDEKRG
ncbi:hypothetical protein KM043_008533 [Ampulex compressa]|nr:hypothetical protein KM043_008533 [Ampulex compressa]